MGIYSMKGANYITGSKALVIKVLNNYKTPCEVSTNIKYMMNSKMKVIYIF